VLQNHGRRGFKRAVVNELHRLLQVPSSVPPFDGAQGMLLARRRARVEARGDGGGRGLRGRMRLAAHQQPASSAPPHLPPLTWRTSVQLVNGFAKAGIRDRQIQPVRAALWSATQTDGMLGVCK